MSFGKCYKPHWRLTYKAWLSWRSVNSTTHCYNPQQRAENADSCIINYRDNTVVYQSVTALCKRWLDAEVLQGIRCVYYWYTWVTLTNDVPGLGVADLLV